LNIQGGNPSICADDSPVDGFNDEGTQDNDCWNIVQDNNCDTNATNTETDCAIGNQSFGQKYDTGLSKGIHANMRWTPLTTIGYTMVWKYSPNYAVGHTTNFKNDEFCSDGIDPCTQGYPLGQETYLTCTEGGGTYAFIKSAGGTDNKSCDINDYSWSTRIFFNGSPNCTSAFVNNATVTKGALGCNGSEWGFTPFGSDFPGGSFSWPNGEWACTTMKVTGIGTSSATIVQTWMTEAGDSSTIVNLSNLDMSYGETAAPIQGIDMNNYHNGGSGVGSGYCTPGGVPGSCDRAYRYEDNIVITNGDPVPCSVAMAEIVGASDTWTINTFSLINPSTCTQGACSDPANVSATASGTATGTILWERDTDCDSSNGISYVTMTECADSDTCAALDECDYSAKTAGTYTATIRSTRGGISDTATDTFQVLAPAAVPGNQGSGSFTLTHLMDLYRDPFDPVAVEWAPSPLEATR
jgi:hypothetical protein